MDLKTLLAWASVKNALLEHFRGELPAPLRRNKKNTILKFKARNIFEEVTEVTPFGLTKGVYYG